MIYEFHNGVLGVQVRFLIDGRNAHTASLKLIGERGLQQKITRGAIIRIRNNAPGVHSLVRFNSLPASWQMAIIDKWGPAPKFVRESLFEKHFQRDAEAYAFYSTYRFSDDTPLSDAKVEEYTINASVLNTISSIYRSRRNTRVNLNYPLGGIWAIVNTEAIRFRDLVPHTLPDNERRLRDKHNDYKKEGYACLISKKHKNSNSRKVTTDIEKILNDLFAGSKTKPTAAEVYAMYDGFLSGYVEVINNETGEVHDPKGFVKLSEATVYNYLNKWENEIGTHAVRSGDRQRYMQRFKPYHSLLQPQFASSLISVDDRQPAFEYADGKRLWFYNAIDLGSEAFTTWVWGKDKAGIITDFYRQMVRNYAGWGLCLPAELEGEMNLNASFANTFLKEGNMFQYVRIEANNARGKRIEAYYRPLRYQYEKKREGWLARPFALSEANQAGADKKQIIPYDDIVRGCLEDIQTWNNSEHSKIKGKSRWEVFLATQNPDLRPINSRSKTRFRARIDPDGYSTMLSP